MKCLEGQSDNCVD